MIGFSWLCNVGPGNLPVGYSIFFCNVYLKGLVQRYMSNVSHHQGADARESAARYLPLNRRNASRFMDDWEPMVTDVLKRMRVREPEEALSRIFHKALRALPEFRGESRLSTWLYRIAWREGIRLVNREKKRDDRETSLELVIQRPDSKDDQLRTLERRETAARVRDSLNHLNVRDREVVALHFFEELPFAQVADRMDISESAAKVRCHRAISRLRIILEDDSV